MDDILARIEQLRRRRGLSMNELSRLAQIGSSCYSQIHRRGTCTLYALRKLADVLGMEITLTQKPGPARVVPLKPCGTVSAARRHQARGEEMCLPCKAVYRTAEAERKRRERCGLTGTTPRPDGRVA